MVFLEGAGTLLSRSEDAAFFGSQTVRTQCLVGPGYETLAKIEHIQMRFRP